MKTLEMNYKIKDLTPELSEQIQKICFDMGIYWNYGSREILNIGYYLFISGRIFTDCDKERYFETKSKEITPQAFIEKYGKKEFNQSKMKWNKDNLEVGDVLEGGEYLLTIELVMLNSVITTSSLCGTGSFDPLKMNRVVAFDELDEYTKVEPKKEWYEEIKEGGVWCLCWEEAGSYETRKIEKVLTRKNEYFVIKHGFSYDNAIPLTEEEIKRFKLNK